MQKPLSSEAHAVNGTSLSHLEWYFLVNASWMFSSASTAHWCLKWKNCIGWLLSSIAFQFYSVSHFTLRDCVLTFLPWKGKSPHFSQHLKPILQHLNGPVCNKVNPLVFRSTMLFSAISCILKMAWNILLISKLKRQVIGRDQWVFQTEKLSWSLLVSLDILFPLQHAECWTSFWYLSPGAWLEYYHLLHLLYSTSFCIHVDCIEALQETGFLKIVVKFMTAGGFCLT